MKRSAQFLPVVFVLLLFITLALPANTGAESLTARMWTGTPFDLINSVNALRASNGLPSYSVSSILMFTAQNQADYMAAIGTTTHVGPGGIGLTDRLLAAGYPLAGDPSLGGFRAENITSGNESMTADMAVNRWTGDALHLNTMLSPDLTKIGAGVSITNGRVYYVIDAARPTTSGALQAVTSGIVNDTAFPQYVSQIQPVVVSTPNPTGEIIHEVQAGQSLWQIAISYDVKIDEIKRWNNLFDDNIYPGEKLLVKKTALVTAALTAAMENIPATEAVSTHTLMPTFTLETATPVQTTITKAVSNSPNFMVIMIGIIVLAIMGGGLFTWLGNKKQD